MKKEQRELSSRVATDRIVDGDSTWGLKDYGGENFRSKYEHAFAVYLKELKIKYEFEKYGEVIENINGVKLHYIPDFYLPDHKTYIEIVNQMNKRLAHKMYAFKAQYNSQRLFVLDRKALEQLFSSKFNIYDLIGYPKKGKS